MNSESEPTVRSELRRFSDRPLLHYFLAISITCIAANFFSAFRTYECLSSRNYYDCRYDPDSPAMVEAHRASIPNNLPVLGHAALISVFSGLFSILLFLALSAPVYALAYYAGRRCGVRRNIAGIAFWTGVWTLAFLSLPILGALFGPGHTSWTVDLSQDYLFVVQGLFCGIVYCVLAFINRDKAVRS